MKDFYWQDLGMYNENKYEENYNLECHGPLSNKINTSFTAQQNGCR